MFAHLRVTRGNESIFQFKVYGSVSYPRQYCNIYAEINFYPKSLSEGRVTAGKAD